MNYSDSGVSIEGGEKFIQSILSLCESTYNAGVYEGIGGFCSLYRTPWNASQLIAASTDGVGSKVILSKQLKEYGYLTTIGIDLVGMVVNDIITCGAIPLFMLDYYATHSIQGINSDDDSIQIIQGIVNGCKWAKVALIGGETAEMPCVYEPDRFDLAGFGIGMVDEKCLLGKHKVKYGDDILGFYSSGPHSNGFSLINSIFETYDWNENPFIHKDLMKPTQIYTKEAAILRNEFSNHIRAMAHITGGGLESNTNRVIPDGLRCFINWNSWTQPSVFAHIQNMGQISDDEMKKVFNCGIGYTAIVDPIMTSRIIARFEGVGVFCIKIGMVG